MFTRNKSLNRVQRAAKEAYVRGRTRTLTLEQVEVERTSCCASYTDEDEFRKHCTTLEHCAVVAGVTPSRLLRELDHPAVRAQLAARMTLA